MKQIVVKTTEMPDVKPLWLPLFEESGQVAVHVTPVADWAEFSRLRSLSREAYNIGEKVGTVLNMKHFLKLLVEATAPDDWRGFVGTDGKKVPFSPDGFLKTLYSNEDLATEFLNALGKVVIARSQETLDLVKNSDAGRATMPTAPGSAKTAATGNRAPA